MALDFSKFSTPQIQEANAVLTALVDGALVAKSKKDKPRDYLGGSRLGVECDRALWFEYHHVQKDPGRDFSGQTLRIFQRGHDCEKRVASYLKGAGFDLRTEREDGSQFGFGIARDPETGRARIAGHIDGVILSGPSVPGMKYPCLWENKGLNAKGVSDLNSKGLKKAKPVYYAQAQVYMAYMELDSAPALFTAECQNTCEIYYELVPFNQNDAQAASDRGARVISAPTAQDAARCTRDPNDFRCKFCDFKNSCWTPMSF